MVSFTTQSEPSFSTNGLQNAGPPLRVCVLGLGGGGFHRQAQRILQDVKRPLELVLVFATPGGGIFPWESPHPVRSAYKVRSPALTGDRFWHVCFYFLVNLFRAAQILLAENPDVVFAVGSVQALPFGIACRLLRRPLWFVESYTRVQQTSCTGRWVYRLRLWSMMYYIWPTLAPYYPHGICASELR